MAIYVYPMTQKGRALEPHQQAMFDTVSGTMVVFDRPADFIYYMNRRPDLRDEVLEGEWRWVQATY